jgi:uncharacterized membrane protein
MTEKNPAGLRIAPKNYRTADIILAIVFLLSAIIGLYFAVADGVRDFWLLVLVGIVGAVLMARRATAAGTGP